RSRLLGARDPGLAQERRAVGCRARARLGAVLHGRQLAGRARSHAVKQSCGYSRLVLAMHIHVVYTRASRSLRAPSGRRVQKGGAGCGGLACGIFAVPAQALPATARRLKAARRNAELPRQDLGTSSRSPGSTNAAVERREARAPSLRPERW